MKMKPGDIWVVEIPALGTHEQSGVRPAVVIARVAKTIVTVIPCTSNAEALRFPFTYAIEPTKQNGLTVVSVALVFHLRALDAVFLKQRIGELDKKTLADIRKLARRLIG
ncbi:MAG TPA: type II toxin-antitoxin system PemK/MazF family toxin [Candidatus Paceibacterota bacterium]